MWCFSCFLKSSHIQCTLTQRQRCSHLIFSCLCHGLFLRLFRCPWVFKWSFNGSIFPAQADNCWNYIYIIKQKHHECNKVQAQSEAAIINYTCDKRFWYLAISASYIGIVFVKLWQIVENFTWHFFCLHTAEVNASDIITD